jgi:hypothetical protein
MNDYEPELLMIDPAKGYVPGNVQVVSVKAARVIEFLRDEAVTREQCERIALFLEPDLAKRLALVTGLFALTGPGPQGNADPGSRAV